jgi:hypothetical protein
VTTAVLHPKQPWEIDLAHHNLGVLRRQGATVSALQCEAWLDRYDPGWRTRPKAVR